MENGVPRAPPPAGAAAARTRPCAANPGGLQQFHLRLEYISERQTRVVLLFQRLGVSAAMAVLIIMVVAQFTESDHYITMDRQLALMNLIIGSVCFAMLAVTAAWFARRVWVARGRIEWGPRRKYLLAMTGVDMALQLANLGFYLAANAVAVAEPCSWLLVGVDVLFLLGVSVWNVIFFLNISRPLILLPAGAWQRWRQRWASRLGRCGLGRCALRSCCCCCRCKAGAGGEGAPAAAAGQAAGQPAAKPAQQPGQVPMQLDARAAAWAHAIIFCFVFLPSMGMVLGATLVYVGEGGVRVCTDSDCTESELFSWELLKRPPFNTFGGCSKLYWDCTTAVQLVVFNLAVGAFMILYAALFLFLSAFVLDEYNRLPYSPNRILNVVARLQLRTRGFTSVFFVLCSALIFYLNQDSCNATLELWLGLGPMHIAMTVLLVSEAILYSPSTPKDCAVRLHSLLQLWAWTEGEAPEVQADRGLPDEPLFCFETALKSCYICMHTYRHFLPESTVSSLPTCMALYGCTHYEWLREPKLDMNCLLLWGPDALVIAFRGTKSLANLKSDAKFWRSPHPPKRGHFWLGMQPLVHTGFLKSWNGAGLDVQVLQRVRQILEGQAHAGHMAPFDTTVVRCCSPEHEERGAQIAEAAAAARAAEAAAGEDMSGYGGTASCQYVLDEEAVAAAAAEVLQLRAASSSTAEGNASGGGTSSAAGAGQKHGLPPPPQQKQREQPFRILITGHSLGGSVGNLCAFDLARQLPQWGFATALWPSADSSSSSSSAALPAEAAAATSAGNGAAAGAEDGAASALAGAAARGRPVSLSLYSFGAPRTGNHAFAEQYGMAVPDSWALINDQDLVAKEGKFFVFKRPGHVALLTPQGDLIVNPSFLERNAHRSSVRSSVSQHLLLSYNKSLAAVLRGQYEGKGIRGGAEAMALLAANPAVRELLVRPLAIRMKSLRRYLVASAGSASAAAPAAAVTAGPAAAEGTAPTAAAAATGAGTAEALPVQVVVVRPDTGAEEEAAAAGDTGTEEEAAAAGEEEDLMTSMQRLASTMYDVATNLW